MLSSKVIVSRRVASPFICGLRGQCLSDTRTRRVEKVRRERAGGKGQEDEAYFAPKWVHPYRQLYPWHSLTDFVDHLYENIVYKDSLLVALDKPWGVGIYRPHVTVTAKNAHNTPENWGDPKYCITDALQPLAERLQIKNLEVVRAIDRNISGLMLLGTSPKSTQIVRLATVRQQQSQQPFMSFCCVTKGYPVINGSYLRERVGIQMVAIDEKGDHKEPQIVVDYPKNKVKSNVVKPVLVDLRILAKNTDVSASLLEITTTLVKWNFIQCYAASKTSFILGDVRFGRRVRQVLGAPFLLSPHNINAYDDFEPLPLQIQKKILTPKNTAVPLMLHHSAITIPRYGKEKKDLLISTNKFPHHFRWTLERLHIST